MLRLVCSTEVELRIQSDFDISTHTPLAGRDFNFAWRFRKWQISTHTPLAGRDFRRIFFYLPARFQLTRPLRGATTKIIVGARKKNISTHTPLAGRDHEAHGGYFAPLKFQLTRPLRGATSRILDAAKPLGFISTHTPLAGRDLTQILLQVFMAISTHTPLAGRDQRVHHHRRQREHFNSHAPCGARPGLPAICMSCL